MLSEYSFKIIYIQALTPAEKKYFNEKNKELKTKSIMINVEADDLLVARRKATDRFRKEIGKKFKLEAIHLIEVLT